MRRSHELDLTQINPAIEFRKLQRALMSQRVTQTTSR
jgi:hypothetical protein